MKKSILTICLLTIISAYTNGQDCKYSKNEFDKALNLHIKTTEREMLTNKKSISADDNILGTLIHKANDSTWLCLGLNILRDHKEDYKINSGMKAYVYFTNGETAELLVAENAKSRIHDKKNFGKYQHLFNVYYNFQKPEYKKFEGTPISKIKMEILNSSGNKMFVETLVEEKYSLTVSKLINCIN